MAIRNSSSFFKPVMYQRVLETVEGLSNQIRVTDVVKPDAVDIKIHRQGLGFFKEMQRHAMVHPIS